MAAGVNNTSHPTNESNEDDHEYKFVVSEHLPFVILSILIVFVNTSVVLLFAFNRKLRKPYNYLFVSLSVSDLITGLVGLPLLLVCSTTPSCLSCILVYPFMRFTSISTVLHILLITYERYAKIVFPLKIHCIGRMSFELKVVASLWCISFVVSILHFAWVPFSEKVCLENDDESVASKNNVYSIILILFFVALPLLLLLCADISVTFVVVRQLNKIDKTSVGGQNSRMRLRKESKVIAISAVMMLYFLVCWSFYYAAVILQSINEELTLAVWMHWTVEILRCTTSLFNPILYVFLKQDFRRAVWLIMKQLARNRWQAEDTTARFSNGTTTVNAGSRTNSRNTLERCLLPMNVFTQYEGSSCTKHEQGPISGTCRTSSGTVALYSSLPHDINTKNSDRC